jgi:hypothetical protein
MPTRRTNPRCSFCGLSEAEVGPMLERTGIGTNSKHVRICQECAKTAIESIEREQVRRGEADATGALDALP